jgi:hypothetical protein
MAEYGDDLDDFLYGDEASTITSNPTEELQGADTKKLNLLDADDVPQEVSNLNSDALESSEFATPTDDVPASMFMDVDDDSEDDVINLDLLNMKLVQMTH